MVLLISAYDNVVYTDKITEFERRIIIQHNINRVGR